MGNDDRRSLVLHCVIIPSGAVPGAFLPSCNPAREFRHCRLELNPAAAAMDFETRGRMKHLWI